MSENQAPLGSPSGSMPPTPVDASVRRKPRWGRRIIVGLLLLVLLLGGLVALAPTIASIPSVTNYALGYVNADLRGKVSVERASFSWLGDSQITGAKVLDPAGRECLVAQSVLVPGGLLRLVRDYYNIGKITITSPEVVLHVDKNGDISLLDAFASKTPSTAKGGEIRIPDAEIALTGGKVRLVREGSADYVVPKLDINIKTQPPGSVVAKLDIGMSDGSSIHGDVDMHDLIAKGELQLAKASGKAKFATDGDLDLRPLGDVVMGPGLLAGKINLDASGDFAAGAVTADLKGAVKGLQSSKVATDSVKPLDLQLAGTVRTNADKVAGDLAVDGDAGKVASQFEYSLTSPPGAEGAATSAALLAGKAPTLPDFMMTAKGQIDLVALADAVPALLHIRPGTKLTGGKVEISKVAAGGPRPYVTADLAVTGLTAVADGKNVQVEPMTAQIDIGAEDDGSMRIRKADVQTGFGKLVASGTPTDLDATFDGDLARVQQQLGQILELPVDELAGTLHADLSAKRTGDDLVDVTANVAGQNVRCRSGSGQVSIDKLQVAHTGAAHLSKGELKSYEIAKADLDADGQVKAAVKGSYDAAKQGMNFDVSVPQADVGYLGRQLAGLGVGGLSGYSGRLQLETKVSRADEAKPVQSQGTLKVQDLAIDGKPLTPTVDASWNDLAYSPADGMLRIPAAKLESAVASVSASKLEIRTLDKVQIAGDIDARADLEKTMPIVGRVAGMAEPPALAGQFAAKMNCRSDGTTSTVSGDGDIKNFKMGTDPQAPQESVSFKYDAALDSAKKTIEVKKLDLDSPPVALALSGRLDDWSGAQRVDVKGPYTLHWDKVMSLLFAMSPSAKDMVKVSGDHKGNLQLAGPLNQPNAKPAYRGLQGGLDASWQSAEVLGIPLSPAKLEPAMRDAQVTLPAVKITAAGGSVNVGGAIDLTGSEPVLKLPPQLAILAGVKVTPQLAEHLLSHFNPIFGKLTRVEGTVDLTARGVELPLGDSLTKGGAGGGRLDLKNFKVQPSAGLMQLLVELGNMGTREMYEVEVSGMDFTVHDGRIHYEALTLRFAQDQFDLMFRGSVGFDDSLDLVVSVPVRQGLLDRLNLTGPAASFTQAMANLRVDVPISGTRENPNLDLSKTNVGKIFEQGVQQTVEKAVKDTAIEAGKKALEGEGGGLEEGIGGLIEGLTGTGEEEAPPPADAPTPKKPAASPKPDASPKPAQPKKPKATPAATPAASPTPAPSPAPKGPRPVGTPKPAKKKPVKSPTPTPKP